MARTAFLSSVAWPVAVATLATTAIAAKPESAPVLACPWSGRRSSHLDDPKERLQGVNNLRRRTDDESVLLLRRVVREDPADPVALAAVDALAERADVGAGDFDLLLSGLAAGTHRAATVAVPASEAVGRYSEDPAHLLGALQNPDASVRLAALSAAGRMRVRAPETFDWRSFLAPLGSDPDLTVRAGAAAAIASIRAP